MVMIWILFACIWVWSPTSANGTTDPADTSMLNFLYASLQSVPQLKGWTSSGGDPCGSREGMNYFSIVVGHVAGMIISILLVGVILIMRRLRRSSSEEVLEDERPFALLSSIEVKAFSCQEHYPSFINSAYLLKTPIEMPFLPQLEVLSNSDFCFHNYYTSDVISKVSTTKARTYESGRNVPTHEDKSDKLSVIVEPHNTEGVSKTPSFMEEREIPYGTSSVQPEDTEESNIIKQKPSGDELIEPGAGELKETEACEEPSTRYVNVRGKEGEVGNSQSLSERARRKKISEKLELLLSLVPGCDQVPGKANKLDETIEYMQSLQRQIEFLSRVLTSSAQPKDCNSYAMQSGDHKQGFNNPFEISDVCSFQSEEQKPSSSG